MNINNILKEQYWKDILEDIEQKLSALSEIILKAQEELDRILESDDFI
jgi:hypothetical protein